jgi:acetyltransferase-like isoleucine patch superfamily enzyme
MMRNRICDYFSNPENRTLIIEHTKSDNILYDWPRVRSPFRLMLNYVLIKLGKVLPLKIKTFVMRHGLGIRIGSNVAIAPEAEFDPFYPELISIGDNVVIGMDSYILTHEFVPGTFRFARVDIRDNAMISGFCVIRSGVTIGEGAQIAMKSFVNKDVPPYELWGGVPAKFIRKIPKPRKGKKAESDHSTPIRIC